MAFETTFIVAQIAVVVGVPGPRALQQAHAHLHGADQRLAEAAAEGARRARYDAGPREADGGRERRPRRRRDREPPPAAAAADPRVHRVRPLPGQVPGVEHRQAAEPEADHHQPARPHVRPGRPAARRAEAARTVDRARAGHRWCPTSSTRTRCGPARPAAPASRSARSTSSTSTRSSTCAATRC